MTNMFYKYDYESNIKDYPKQLNRDCPERLDSEPENVEIIRDTFGNEIGIRACANTSFSLYFNIENRTPDVVLDDLFLINRVIFEIIDPKLGSIIVKEVQNDFRANYIKVDLTANDYSSEGLTYGVYKMRLTLFLKPENPEDEEIPYALFSENDGLLFIQ